MAQKLDSFKKILLATGQINYLASAIQEVIEGSKMNEDVISAISGGLASIMEMLAEIANDHDFTLPIDERISRVPFEILLHDMDDVESDYEISKPG